MTKVPYPTIPIAPAEYDPSHQQTLQRLISNLIVLLNTNGPAQHSELTLTDLQDDDVALRPGSVYKSGNALHISTINTAAVRGAQATGGVGSVTVAIA